MEEALALSPGFSIQQCSVMGVMTPAECMLKYHTEEAAVHELEGKNKTLLNAEKDVINVHFPSASTKYSDLLIKLTVCL